MAILRRYLMKSNLKNLLLTGVFALFTGSVIAQEIDALRKQYPDEQAVLMNRTLQYNITVKDDLPEVLSHETQQIAFLTSAAATLVNNYSFSHSDFQQLVAYEAHTNTADKKVLKVNDFKTVSDKQSFVFYDDQKETTFNFPAIEPGGMGSLDVSWHSKDPHLLPPYYFESYMPVVNSQLKITASNDVVLKFNKIGLDTARIVMGVEKGRRNTVYTFTLKNCPPGRHYGDAPGYAWFAPHVLFCIEKYKDKAGNWVSYLANIDDLYRLNYGFIKSINTQVSPELKRITDSLTVSAGSTEEKARRIYAWVQYSIKYVAFEDGLEGFVPRDAGLVCTRRFGDCKDMASILTQMMRAANIPAYFTWIGTRHLPYTFTQTPLPLVSNHMICTINLDGKFVFLDGTDPTCVFGMPSEFTQDKEAMISVTDKEYKILKVPAIEKNCNVLTDTTWLEMGANGIKGRIKQNLQGYFASEMYSHLMYWTRKDMRDHMNGLFSRGSNKFKLDTFAVDRKTTTDQISLAGTFSLPDYAKKLGNEYYLNLNLFKFFANDRIDYPKRTTPVESDFKNVRKYVTILKLPDGYKLTYLPASKEFRNDVWGFNLKYEQKSNEVVMTQEFEENNLLLTADKFEAWNKVLDNLLPLYKETLSLEKL